MAETTVRFVGCLLALLTALSLSLIGPATAGVSIADGSTGVASATTLDDPRPSVGPQFSNMPPSPDADNTVTRITVAENGSATWTLQIRTRLGTDTEAEQYRDFQQRFRNNTSNYLGSFSESIENIVDNARTATGRDMQASNFEASTSIQSVPRRWGVITYRFSWSGFAQTEGQRVVVGDIFQGGYLIAENDTFAVVGPSDYHIAAVDPAPNERGEDSVSWDGREDFATGHPRVEFAPGPAPTGNQAQNQTPGVIPSMELLGSLGGLAILLAGAVIVARRRGYDIGPNSTLGSTTSTTDGGATPADAAGPTTPASGTESATSISPDKRDRELLADVDKVTRVLQEAGGRMKQSEIGEELDWSKAKTSRVLSRLEDDGEIEKLRLGRENVIDLADDDDQST